jgi:hypothetical protein
MGALFLRGCTSFVASVGVAPSSARIALARTVLSPPSERRFDMPILGGLIGGALKGGLLKGAAGGLLKGGGGGLLKGLAGKGGLLGKALEAVGGPQGIMDMVSQFAQGGGGAEEAGGAEGGQDAAKGKGGDEKNPLVKLAKQFANAKSPKDVDKLVKGLKKKLGKKASPEFNKLIDQIADARKASLAGGGMAKAA